MSIVIVNQTQYPLILPKFNYILNLKVWVFRAGNKFSFLIVKYNSNKVKGSVVCHVVCCFHHMTCPSPFHSIHGFIYILTFVCLIGYLASSSDSLFDPLLDFLLLMSAFELHMFFPVTRMFYTLFSLDI